MAVIHVHDFAFERHLPLLDQAASRLPGDELARAARFKAETARAEYLLTRLLLRRLLTEHTNTVSGPFVYGPHGKPALSGGIEFNISHSRGRLLIAFCADHPVGVDVERIDPAIDPVALARTGLPDADVAALLAAPEETRHLLFYRFWTRHEAFLKALGAGLGHVPEIVAWQALGDGTERLDQSGDTGSMVVCELPAAEGYRAALAVAGCTAAPEIVRHPEN